MCYDGKWGWLHNSRNSLKATETKLEMAKGGDGSDDSE